MTINTSAGFGYEPLEISTYSWLQFVLVSARGMTQISCNCHNSQPDGYLLIKQVWLVWDMQKFDEQFLSLASSTHIYPPSVSFEKLERCENGQSNFPVAEQEKAVALIASLGTPAGCLQLWSFGAILFVMRLDGMEPKIGMIGSGVRASRCFEETTSRNLPTLKSRSDPCLE